MRVAHISDIHLRQFSSLSWSDLLTKRTVGALNLLFRRNKQHDPSLFDACCKDILQQRPDEVVITGDVTNLSLDSEFALVAKKLALYGFSPEHTSIIPGNHDIYVKEAKEKQAFESFLRNFCTSDGMTDRNPIEFPFVRIRDSIAIIGVNSAIPTLPFSAAGMVGTPQLSRLRHILRSLENRYRIVLIHHPPLPYRKDHLRGLEDKQALAQVLQEVGCELILHGHEHRDLQGWLPGPKTPIPVLGVGSGTYHSPHLSRRARYCIYTIEQGKLTQIETRVHHPVEHQFVRYQVSRCNF